MNGILIFFFNILKEWKHVCLLRTGGLQVLRLPETLIQRSRHSAHHTETVQGGEVYSMSWDLNRQSLHKKSSAFTGPVLYHLATPHPWGCQNLSPLQVFLVWGVGEGCGGRGGGGVKCPFSAFPVFWQLEQQCSKQQCMHAWYTQSEATTRNILQKCSILIIMHGST